jgi:hypothetical protein
VDDPAAIAGGVERAARRTVTDQDRDRVVARFSSARLCADLAELYAEELQRAGVA